MEQKILEILDFKFKYDETVLKSFFRTLEVRFGKNSELYSDFQNFPESIENVKEMLKKEEFVSELKHLNQMNLTARLAYLEKKHTPQTVVITYMQLLVKEINLKPFRSPSLNLVRGEQKMLDHLLNTARLNENWTEFEGLSNTNLRLVLQTWVLYPEFSTLHKEIEDVLECFYLFDLNL